jgi:UTP--glucose-1-phosphate uridylyltransferase
MQALIRKAIFPVAGLGTRFLPATKANPKEMLPIVDKPLIQYAVEEAIAAGITQLIFITSGSKRAIEDHFDRNHELENILELRGLDELLESVQSILPEHAHCVYVRQPYPDGLGGAVLCAQQVIGDEPFAVLLADDLMEVAPGARNVMQQMVDEYQLLKTNIIAIERIPIELSNRYGIVAVDPDEGSIKKIQQIVEKPNPEVALSDMAVVGRYILQPEIFPLLEQVKAKATGETQLTDGIAELLHVQDCYAYEFIGRRYDCGNKLGYVQATLSYALRHPEIGKQFKQYLEDEFSE